MLKLNKISLKLKAAGKTYTNSDSGHKNKVQREKSNSKECAYVCKSWRNKSNFQSIRMDPWDVLGRSSPGDVARWVE